MGDFGCERRSSLANRFAQMHPHGSSRLRRNAVRWKPPPFRVAGVVTQRLRLRGLALQGPTRSAGPLGARWREIRRRDHRGGRADVFPREYFSSLNSLSQSLACVCACCGHKCTAVRCTVRTGEGAHLVPKALWTRSCDDPHRYAHPKGGLAFPGRSQPQIQHITASACNGWQVEGRGGWKRREA